MVSVSSSSNYTDLTDVSVGHDDLPPLNGDNISNELGGDLVLPSLANDLTTLHAGWLWPLTAAFDSGPLPANAVEYAHPLSAPAVGLSPSSGSIGISTSAIEGAGALKAGNGPVAVATQAASLPSGFFNVADAIHAANLPNGIDGAGAKVGIISDSFNVQGSASTAVADGALPPVSVQSMVLIEGPQGSSDEGCAMAEIVHSIAPGAQILFASADTAGLNNAITDLQQAGCNIIVDDIYMPTEPIFQQGSFVDTAIDAAVANGVTYFTAAGNSGNSYYESVFAPMTLPSGTFENFGTAAQPRSIETLNIPNNVVVNVTLEWNQPYATVKGIASGPGSANSLGFYILDSNNNIVAERTVNQVGFDPLAFFSFATHSSGSTSYGLEIFDNGGPNTPVPGLFEIIVDDNSASPVQFLSPNGNPDANAATGSGDILGHALDPNAITVGAAPVNNLTTMEPFSSYGAGEFLFDANGNPLGSPLSPDKPTIVAPDGNPTTVAGLDPFSGTSAAAPAAAAVGALILQASPTLDPSDVANLLADSATAIGNSAQSGDGLINAAEAVNFAQSGVITAASGEPSVLDGTHLGNTFIGDGTSETYKPVGGTNTIVEGSGIDTVIVAGVSSTATTTVNSDGSLTVTSAAITDHITNIGYLNLDFTDRTIPVGDSNHVQIAALYQAALDRAPDANGLAYWVNIYMNNMNASIQTQGPYVALAETSGNFNGGLSIAQGFTQSLEFLQKYGNLTNQQLIAQLYENVLDRAPDPAGDAYWNTALTTGIDVGHGVQVFTQAMVLVGFAESSENLAKYLVVA